ncbi:MAG TPA: ZIP family metal transporter [Armatimonadota bacterium]|nr:ZIP family metal transporter [Armatimonadota bacterium]
MFQLLVYSLTAGIATLAGALAILARKQLSQRTITRLMGFGSGVLAGAAFLHLIPGSIKREPLAAGWAMLASLLLFIAIEQFVHARSCRDHKSCEVGVVGVMGFIALFIHSLVDGLAITAGFRASRELGLAAAFAVIGHEVPEGITSVSMFAAAGYARRLTLLLASLVAFATPGGALVSWFCTAGVGERTLAMLLGFAAGSFIYVATADILPRLHEMRDIPAFLYLLAGAAIPMALLLLEH